MGTAPLDTLQELQDAHRALTALGRCSEAAFGAEDALSVYREICNILVREAGYRMAWIGVPEQGGDHRVLPVASTGDDGGYLAAITVRWDDSPEGEGPTGRAIRSGETQVLNDTTRADHFRPWRDSAMRHGFRSVAVLPLKHNAQVFATLAVYSTGADTFNAHEIALLERMARKIAFAVAALREHAQRESAEHALHVLNERFRATFEQAAIGMAHTSLDGRWMLVNQRLCEILGTDQARLLGARFQDLVHPDEAAAAAQALHLLQAADSVPSRDEWRIERPDGRQIWVRRTASLVQGVRGEPGYLVETLEEVTAIKQSEARVRQTTAHLLALYDATPDMVFLHAADGRVLDVNENTLRGYGFSREEMLTLPFSSFTGGHCTMEQAADYVRRALAGESVDFEWVARRRNGDVFPVEVRLRRLGENSPAAALIAVVRDISTRKSAEAALRESEERFRNLVETSVDWVWETDAQGRYSYVSPRARDILGYAPDEILGRSVFEFVREDLRPQVMAQFGALARDQRPFDGIESIHVHKDGRDVVIETIGLPYYGAAGECLGYRGVDRDVTERRRSERRLREQEERYRLLVEAMSEGIMVVDAQTRILTCNPSCANILGVPAERLLNHPLSTEIVKPLREDGSELPPAEYPYRLALESGKPRIGVAMGLLRADGSRIWLDANAYPLFREGATEPAGVLITFTDVTERRNHLATLSRNYQELETAHRELKSVHAQLLQSEKMASIGHLAAGIAHEINNPVGYVNANLGSMGEYVDDLFTLIDACREAAALAPADHPARRRVDELSARIDLPFLQEDMRALLRESREGITRVKQIVQDLKDFSRSDAGDWQWGNINRGLDSTLNIVWNELKYKARVEKDYGDLPEIECVPSQLNQVFMNLLVNAAQAIESHGEIAIRTRAGGDWVSVAISDTGCGIPPENLTKLFDPFFTTKPVGQGTGLGLSISYGIVAKHGGRIEVASEPGRGTTFTIHLPVRRAAVGAD